MRNMSLWQSSSSNKITSFFARDQKRDNATTVKAWPGYKGTSYTYSVDGKPVTVDLTLSNKDLEPGEDNGIPTWYADKLYIDNDNVGNNYSRASDIKGAGTFRSTQCKKLIYDSDICVQCRNIPNQKSFLKRVILRHKRTCDGNPRSVNKILISTRRNYYKNVRISRRKSIQWHLQYFYWIQRTHKSKKILQTSRRN